MNVTSILTKDYERNDIFTVSENKPNSNPIKANFRRAKMNVNSLITKDYRKKDDFAVRKNKPNSKPISVKPKMNVNFYLTKDYENELCQKLQKNKPKQTQFQTRSEFIPKGAEIPTGELLGILKPGTNFKRYLAKMGHHELRTLLTKIRRKLTPKRYLKKQVFSPLLGNFLLT